MSLQRIINHAQSDPHKYIGLPLNVLFVIFCALLMQAIGDLRVSELGRSLNEARQSGSGLRSASLIARYQMLKSSGLSSAAKTEMFNEARLLTMLSGEGKKLHQNEITLPWLRAPAKLAINGINFIAGAPPFLEDKEDMGQRMLEMAYFYERKREFAKAVFVYNAAQKFHGPQHDLAPYIYLHRGFCLSLYGYREQALEDYHRTMALDKEGELAVTAEVLADLLEQTRNALQKIDRMPLSLEKGIAYHRNTANKQALAVFNKLENSSSGSKLYYYRGRSREELGQTEQAIADYQQAIRKSPGSSLAILANRRLYMLAAFYGNNEKLKEETRKRAIASRDSTLQNREIASLEKTVDSKQVAEITKSQLTKEVIEFVNETNTGGEKKPVKATDEKAAEKKAEEIDTDDFDEMQKKIFIEEAREIEKKQITVLKTENLERNVRERENEQKQTMITSDVEKKKKELAVVTDVKKEIRIYTEEELLSPEMDPVSRRRALRNQYRRLDVLFTVGGDVLVGKITSETSDKLTIITLFGGITINRDRIVMRQKLMRGRSAK